MTRMMMGMMTGMMTEKQIFWCF